MGEVEIRVQLFAKAKELAGGRDCLVCALQLPADASISCEDFLERYVYTVAATPAARRPPRGSAARARPGRGVRLPVPSRRSSRPRRVGVLLDGRRWSPSSAC